MNKVWKVAVVLLFVGVAAPIAIMKWEQYKLASASDESAVRDLLGDHEEIFSTNADLEKRFGNWDFHDVSTGEITYTADLPAVTDRVYYYVGRLGKLTEYIVFFEGEQITSAYFIGAN